MFDIVTFGSGTQDIFVQSKNFTFLKDESFVGGQGICIGAGSKFYIDQMLTTIGGCGVNTAFTFALQGLKTIYCGKVGSDLAGRQIVEKLTEVGAATNLVVKTDELMTSHSIILTAPDKERTILIYRGASNSLTEQDINWDALKNTKWFYVAPMSGDCAPLFTKLLEFSQKNNIQVSMNLGASQIKMGLKKLRPLLNLSAAKIVNLNQEEAAQLTDVDFKNEKEIFKALDEIVQGTVVMTKGPQGVVVSDGEHLYSAGVPSADYVDRTGAGDAFGSGFTTAIIQGKSIEEAIQLATANATGCVQELGATNGLLKKNGWGPWPRVVVERKEI